MTSDAGMPAIARYDSDLNMFVEQPHAVDPNHAAFLRWLVEHDRCEHGAAGPSSGALTDPQPPLAPA
jgi:hypothetical protein